MINNHTADNNTNLDRNIPLDHTATDDAANLVAPNATNTGLTGIV